MFGELNIFFCFGRIWFDFKKFMLFDTCLNLTPHACKHVWNFKYEYFFFKNSGLDFGSFVGGGVTLCGTSKHFTSNTSWQAKS